MMKTPAGRFPAGIFFAFFGISTICLSPNVDKVDKICYNLVTKFFKGVFSCLKPSPQRQKVSCTRAIRRVDNLIYYGTMAEKYIIMMQVLESKKEQDLNVATKVSVQLQLTDPNLKSRDRVVKKSEKDSLYAAMDVAAIWLDRALAGKEK